MLAKLDEQALKLIGIFYCQVQPSSRRKEIFNIEDPQKSTEMHKGDDNIVTLLSSF